MLSLQREHPFVLDGTGPIDHDEHGPFRLLGLRHSALAMTLRWDGTRWAKGRDHDPLSAAAAAIDTSKPLEGLTIDTAGAPSMSESEMRRALMGTADEERIALHEVGT